VFRDDFSALSTKELNIAHGFVASSKLFELSKNKWKTSDCMSPFRDCHNGSFVFHKRGDVLLMSIPNEGLQSRIYTAPDISGFVTI